MSNVVLSSTEYKGIHGDIIAITEGSRRAAALSVNAAMTATYWEFGRRVVEFEQSGKTGQRMVKRCLFDCCLTVQTVALGINAEATDRLAGHQPSGVPCRGEPARPENDKVAH